MTGRLHARLSGRLPGASRGAVTDVMLLLGGIRELVRMSCRVEDAEPLAAACRDLGLASARWPGTLHPTRTAPGGFVLTSAPSPEGSEGPRTFVFAARSERSLQEGVETVLDDAAAGAALGYPACCIHAYADNASHYARRTEPAFARGGGGPWPFWTNTVVDVLGWHLLPHFPCAPDCAPSRDHALASWSCLARSDPQHAADGLVRLRSIVLVGRDGIAFGHEEAGEFVLAGSTGPARPDAAERYNFTGHA